MACCGCAYTCAPPVPVQICGLSPSFGVNQGPVYSGPGYYTSPTYEGETLTADYPYVGYGNYPRHDYPAYEYPYSERFRHRHFGMLYRHETDAYRHGLGPRAITMVGAEGWESPNHRELRDLRYR
jgi:hypothetical protein